MKRREGPAGISRRAVFCPTVSPFFFISFPVEWDKLEGGGPMGGNEDKRVLRLGVGSIRPNPRQPRRLFDETGLKELAASIRRHGILQPLVVRRRADGWELVAGERRLRAARLAGLETVPCVEAEVDERESALLALVENLQRQDLHYFEEAAAIADYLRRTGATQEEAAAQLGRSPSAVANKLRLLKLSPACQALLLKSGLTERHARALLRLEDEEERLAAAKRAADRQLNVAQTEQYIERRLAELQTSPPAGRRTYIIKDVRLFLNSVDRGLRIVREAGVEARCQRQDTDDEIVMTIRIPRRP